VNGAAVVDFDVINSVRFAAANDNAQGANGQIQVDELRIGTTFADAIAGTIAIPEPSTAALGLLGSLALFRRSRRK
jgi:PEP-CTERM motif